MKLAGDVYLTQIDDRSVVLDLAKDRYVGLSASLTRSALALLDPGVKTPSHGADRAKLIQRGILTDQPTMGPSFDRDVATAVSTLWPSRPLRQPHAVDWIKEAQAIWSLRTVSHMLRTLPFRETIYRLHRMKRSGASEVPIAKLQCQLDGFAAARPWFPITPVCRLDAPALCLHLWRRSIPAALVFGVRLDPFAAHCWVQLDDRVLNEPYDTTRQYTPILVI